MLLRRIKFFQKYIYFIDVKSYHAAFLLSFSGLIYFVLICSNSWVQLNSSFIINYAIPAVLIFFAAIVWFFQPIILALSEKSVLVIGTFFIILVSCQTLVFKPDKYSEQFNSAKLILNHTDDDNSIDDFSLIGDFWTSLVYSWFDPDKLMASGFNGQALTDITLPLALERKCILINYKTAPEKFSRNESKDYFTQNNCLLVKTDNNHELTEIGWHSYQNLSLDELITGSNIIKNIAHSCSGGAAISNNIFYMNKTGDNASEILWNIGSLPEGLYMLKLSARYKHEIQASGILAMHLADAKINPDYPMIAIKPGNTSCEYKTYKTLLYYHGSNVPTKLRIYSLSDKPFEIETVGIFPVKLNNN